MARAAVLGVRQEPFEFGVCFLSLVPRVVEDFSSLTTIKAKLYAQAEESGCISADGVAKALGFSKVHAQVCPTGATSSRRCKGNCLILLVDTGSSSYCARLFPRSRPG